MTDRLRKKFGSPPASARVFAETVAGDRSTITETSFTEEEVSILRDVAERALQKGKKVIGYGDYGGDKFEKSFVWDGTDAATAALSDPRSALSFTLGMAKVHKEKNGTIVITDEYDFAASKDKVDKLKKAGTLAIIGKIVEGFKQNGLLGIGNVIGNLAVPESHGRKVEIRIPPERGEE